MDSFTGTLPILDGTNYTYWKIRLSTHIKANDRRVWSSIVDGFDMPECPVSGWTILETFNYKAMDAIFATVDMKMFHLIQECKTAKEAWDILQHHCEGDDRVREVRLRLVMSRFEALRMGECEDITTYFGKLLCISSECQMLGDPLSNKQLVSKAVRTLSKRFSSRVSDIEKDYDLAKMDFGTLQDLLRSYELMMNMNYTSRSASNRVRNDLKHLKSIRCDECSGWGHFANECANTGWE